MANLRDMPYIRQLAEYVVWRETGSKKGTGGHWNLQTALWYLDALSYNDVAELWQEMQRSGFEY